MADKKKSTKTPKSSAAFKKALKKKSAAKKPVAKKAAAKKPVAKKPAARKVATPKPTRTRRAAAASKDLDAALAGLAQSTGGVDIGALSDAQTALTAAPAAALPEGALLVLRTSGGLNFSSTETVVYASGRITEMTGGEGTATELVARKATPAQLAAIQAAITDSAFADNRVVSAPDGIVHEILGRVAASARRTEASSTHTSPALRALIKAVRG
jgi:hypothetical protein